MGGLVSDVQPGLEAYGPDVHRAASLRARHHVSLLMSVCALRHRYEHRAAVRSV